VQAGTTGEGALGSLASECRSLQRLCSCIWATDVLQPQLLWLAQLLFWLAAPLLRDSMNCLHVTDKNTLQKLLG
jgi:hypothetical protein